MKTEYWMGVPIAIFEHRGRMIAEPINRRWGSYFDVSTHGVEECAECATEVVIDRFKNEHGIDVSKHRKAINKRWLVYLNIEKERKEK